MRPDTYTFLYIAITCIMTFAKLEKSFGRGSLETESPLSPNYLLKSHSPYTFASGMLLI
jgi:hypothetical protein